MFHRLSRVSGTTERASTETENAMAALTIQTVVPNGLAATYTAASGGGDSIADDGKERTFLHVKNGGGSSINVTVVAQKTSVMHPQVGPVTISNVVVAVPNGQERMIGPFADAFRDLNGNVQISYSGVSSVTVAAINVGARTL
jgi:hypothetical protein